MDPDTVDPWLTSRRYPTAHRAAEAWLDRYKRLRASGQPTGPIRVSSLGGGWWFVRRADTGSGVPSPGRKLQGFGALAPYLLGRGQLRKVDGGYQVAVSPSGYTAAPEPEPGAPAAPPTPVWLTPAFRLRELERDASALLAKVGALCGDVDSARTSAALGYVKSACEELKQARIVAEVRAKYEQDASAPAAEPDASAYQYRAKLDQRR